MGCGEDEARPYKRAPRQTGRNIPVAPVVHVSDSARAAGFPTSSKENLPQPRETHPVYLDPNYTPEKEARRLLNKMPRVYTITPRNDPPKTAEDLARYVNAGGIDNRSDFYDSYKQLPRTQQFEYIKKYRKLLHRSKKTRGGRRSRRRRGVRRRRTRHRPAKRRTRNKRQRRKKRRSRRRR